ncbi:PAS domain S-box protein [Brevundimonas sp.]|uniref:PAS domain S-box protein n=1 Tax=Brevundimonas sp. TaxID=1871086 RepID=UPI00260FFF02|nr:PAS domain S-box protein [Brevundimonas sp.]
MSKSNSFDRLTELAAAMFDAPIALITALDDERQWFRSNRGYGEDQTTAEESFCRHMIGSEAGTTLVVEDAALDDRFAENRLVVVQGVRFYAGAVITTADGGQDGAVCVIDTVPRAAPTDAQIESLKLLAQLAGQQIDHARLLRRQSKQAAMLEMAEELAGLGRWRFDLVTGKVDWSNEVYRIHGREPASFDPSYADVLADYHPEDREILSACVERAIATGQGYNLELRLSLTNRGERRVITRSGTETGDDGRPIALFGVFQDVTDIVRTRERLERSEALFREMSEKATDIISRYALDGTFLYLSPSVETIMGYRPDEMVGRNCMTFIPPEEAVRVEAIVRAYVKAGPGTISPRYEYRAIRKDGTTIWLEASPRAIWDEAGCKVIEFHDHVRDITERKAAERAQAELVETLGMAEQLGGVGCWKLDVADGSVTWSDEVYRIHGKTRATFDPSFDDAVGCYHPDDQPVVAEVCRRAIETGEGGGFQLRLIREDGEERIVTSECRPERAEDGTTTALFGVFQDVTDRVRSQQRIEASEARYRLLADRASDIIVTYGVDGLIQYISPSVEAATGIAPGDLVGRPVTHLILEEDVQALTRRFRDMVRARPGTVLPGLVYRARMASGEVRWMEARTTLIRNEAGRVVEFHDVVRDITETKRLEDELIAARDVAEAAAKAKSEFLANMSHELRTPLTSVIGFSGLLLSSEVLPEAERRYADRIATSSEALLSVINDILDYSKLEADAVGLDPVAFDPAAMVRGAASIIETQCEARGLTLAMTTSAALPDMIMGDEGRLRQVTLNFLSNAVKFTASGEIRLDLRTIGERLRVSVTDSGIGIAPEKIDGLFDRFTQADASTTRVYGGTGLGLAISRRLIELMGGEIGAESRPGEGSTFWFEIPLIEAEGDVGTEADYALALAPGTRILLADDAPANRELVRIILSGWGVELDTVCNGAEAVDAASRSDYDVILMDVHMPVMDGMDATRAIRALGGARAALPILALTANVQPDQVEACARAGMDGHVGKPIQISELIAAIAGASRPMIEQDRILAAN